MPAARLRWTNHEARVEQVITGTRSLGYDHGADIALRADGIAARHLELAIDATGVWVRDLGPEVLLDGQRLAGRERIPDRGATLRLGTLELEVRPVDPMARAGLSTGETVRALVARGTASTDDIIVRGEPGSGRRALARAIHEASRPGEPFVVLDPRHTPAALIESALFGLMRSSCFGPRTESNCRRGPFELAGAGTIVLGELSAIPRDVQLALAHVLARRAVRRIGDNQRRPFAARVIATTLYDLPGRVQPELRDRFAGELVVPPLRERLDELAPLLRQFEPTLEIAPGWLARLARLAWRGNVAELRRVAGELARHGERAIAERELLDQIAAAPDDDMLRLVYGDLLLTRGDPRGELVQVQCQLADRTRPATGQARRSADQATDLAAVDLERLRAVERGLLTAHGAAWRAPVLAGAQVAGAELVRGFVEEVRGPIDLIRRLDLVLHHAPMVSALYLDPADAWAPLDLETLDQPLLARVRRLHLGFARVCDDSLAAVAACPHLANLRELVISTASATGSTKPRSAELVLGNAGARALASSTVLANLRALVLDGCYVTTSAIGVLAGASRLRLDRLSLASSGLDRVETRRARRTLARSRSLSRTEVWFAGERLTRSEVLAHAAARLARPRAP